MARKIEFDPEDEEFFGKVGSFGVPKFDNEMHGGVPRGFMMVAFTDTGSGSELFAKQFTSPAEEAENTIYISTNEGQHLSLSFFEFAMTCWNRSANLYISGALFIFKLAGCSCRQPSDIAQICNSCSTHCLDLNSGHCRSLVGCVGCGKIAPSHWTTPSI